MLAEVRELKPRMLIGSSGTFSDLAKMAVALSSFTNSSSTETSPSSKDATMSFSSFAASFQSPIVLTMMLHSSHSRLLRRIRR